MKLTGACVYLFAIFCWLSIPTWAQVATGTINISAVDATGGMVPGAAIQVTNNGTGLVRSGTANERGELSIPYLPVGQYSISVQTAGFKKTTIDQVVLQVDQTASIRVTLQPGEVREVIEVKEVASALEAETSSLGQVIENKKILELPLNGRNAFAWVCCPATRRRCSAWGRICLSSPAAAASPRTRSRWMASITIPCPTPGSIGRNGIAVTPSVDAVQEFKVKTSTFSAEFGHAAGAVMNATIKSGTNELHGTVFEFLRNDKLDANNFFTNAAGQARPAFRQNQFGAAVGGPIVHNRTFFFGDYQGTRIARAGGSSINDIPPAALRTGDFSKANVVIYDPGSRRIGPTGLVIADPLAGQRHSAEPDECQFPCHSGADSAAQFWSARSALAELLLRAAAVSNTDQGDVRIDQIISAKDNVYGRFSISDRFHARRGQLSGLHRRRFRFHRQQSTGGPVVHPYLHTDAGQ